LERSQSIDIENELAFSMWSLELELIAKNLGAVKLTI
jgi:hypothetical protein